MNMPSLILGKCLVATAIAASGQPSRISWDGQLETRPLSLDQGVDVKAVLIKAKEAAKEMDFIFGRTVTADSPSLKVAGSWFDINVTMGGRGSSDNFTKSSCLFCSSHKNAARERAEARAIANARFECEENKKGFVMETPAIIDSACERVDGWWSYYVCGALASATCRIIPERMK